MRNACFCRLPWLKRIPLKREYWDKAGVRLRYFERHRAFRRFSKTRFPTSFWPFRRVFARDAGTSSWRLPSGAVSRAAIETFMRTSNYPVCEEASEAALYEIDNFKMLDWRTLQVREVEPMQWPETVASQ